MPTVKSAAKPSAIIVAALIYAALLARLFLVSSGLRFTFQKGLLLQFALLLQIGNVLAYPFGAVFNKDN
jgi:hypothetical protein